MKAFLAVFFICCKLLDATAIAYAADCNANRIEDQTEIAQGAASDCNSNQVPDSCDVQVHGLSFAETVQITSQPFWAIPHQNVLVDLTNDHFADLIGTNGSGMVGGRSNQRGSFPDRQDLFFAGGSGLYGSDTIADIVTGDFDGDGDIDVVFNVYGCNRSNCVYQLYELQNPGQGQFLDKVPVSYSPGDQLRSAGSLLAADVNNDGKSDLVFVGIDAADQSRLAVGLGTSTPGQLEVRILPANKRAWAVVDLDGDHDLDLLTEHGFLINDGTGYFVEHAFTFAQPFPETWQETIKRVLAADFDRNGLMDLAVFFTRRPAAGIYYNYGDFNFSAPYFIEAIDSPAVADIDVDGRPDIIGINSTISAPRALLNRNGRFSSYADIRLPEGMSGLNAVGDMNNDGKPDLLVSAQDLVLAGLLNTTATEVTSPTSSDRNHNTVPDECERAVAGDYDGDGRTDIVVARQLLGGWYWFIRYATAHESAPIQFGLANPQYVDSISAEDYDGDGRFEPGVVRDMLGGLWWFWLNDEGTATMLQWGLSGDHALTGHFDGDRRADPTVVRTARGGLDWYIKRTSGEVIFARQWGLAGDSPYAGDLNGDGVDELVVARNINGFLYWYALDIVTGQPLDVIQWGIHGDIILSPYDFSGRGQEDIVVVRPLAGAMVAFVWRPWGGIERLTFGLSGDVPFVGNFSGLMSGDFGVYRPAIGQVSTHYILEAPTGLERRAQFGLAQDYLVRSDGRGVYPDVRR